MSAKFSLDGGMIPRTVKRMFDQRSEERVQPGSQTAVLTHRGGRHVVRLVNMSREGAMVGFAGSPYIGDPVSLQLIDCGDVTGHVRWVRDGRVGIHFASPLE